MCCVGARMGRGVVRCAGRYLGVVVNHFRNSDAALVDLLGERLR